MTREITAEIFTTDYKGTPGKRSFFLQARRADETITLGAEKQQISLLAEKMGELLLMIDREDTVTGAPPARDPALDPRDEEPEDRVGAIALAYDEDGDRVLVAIDPLVPEGGEVQESEMPGTAPGSVRILIRRDQARAFVLHAMAVVDEGRPLCRLCGLPMDPDGHSCPASNGHRVQA